MKKMLYLAAAIVLPLSLGGCPELRAINDQMEANMNQYPGGALGWGLDAALLGNQVRGMRGGR